MAHLDGADRAVTVATLWPESDPEVLAPVEGHDDLRAVVRSAMALHDPNLAPNPDTSASLWRSLAHEVDIVGIALPAHLGGAGFGMRELGVVLEEAGAALVDGPVLGTAALGAHALAAADRPEDFSDLLSSMRDGRVRTTVWTGEGVLDLELSGSGGELAVSGNLARLLNGVDADHVVVPARSAAGAQAVVVDLTSAAEVTPCRAIDDTRGLGDLRLQGARARIVASAERSEEFWRDLAIVRDIAVSAEHAGGVARLLEGTVEFVRQRVQFGAPIGSMQAIKHRLADVLVERERCLSACRYAAAIYDRTGSSVSSRLAASVAASVCGEALVKVAHEAIQLHGAIGFTWEHWAHRYLRRGLGDEGLFGSAHARRLEIAEYLCGPA